MELCIGDLKGASTMSSEKRKRKRAAAKARAVIEKQVERRLHETELDILHATVGEEQPKLEDTKGEMPTANGTKIERLNSWISGRQALLGILVAVLAIVVPVIMSIFQTISIDGKLGGINTRVSVLKAHLDAVTDVLAPQLRDAIQSSLTDAANAQDQQGRSVALARTATAFGALSVGHVRADDSRLVKVGLQLSAVVDANPTLASGWSAIAALVTYRSASATGFPANKLPNCWDTFSSHREEHIDEPGDLWDEQMMGNCDLTLDKDDVWLKSGFGKAYSKNASLGREVLLRLHVHDAVVSYQGGDLVPFITLDCQNCTFVTSASTLPSPGGQKLMLALVNSDIRNVSYLNSSSAASAREEAPRLSSTAQ